MKKYAKVEVQDIFNIFGSAYRDRYGKSMPLRQHRTMRAIEICRTAELGGHIDKCDSCGKERISYNSCRNRHCPKCQFLKKEKWLEDRLKDFLPIQYFHVVFTLPDILNPLILRNQKTAYNILFRSISETLKELSKDEKHLGAKIGFICVLHTWSQNLMDHPHMHCIVTGGGLANDQKQWLHSRDGFFIHVKVMATLFKKKYLAYLKESYIKNSLVFPGKIYYLKKSVNFNYLLSSLYKKEWVVFSKPPFKRPETVFQYLSRYTHRIAISNQRIVKIQNDNIFFKWRDYSDANKMKVMKLDAFEFIRRFLLHVLPDKFVKIRYYGLLGNRNRKVLLKKCRKILGVNNEVYKKSVESWQTLLLRITGFDVERCPFCKKGKMIFSEFLIPNNCNSPPKEEF